MEISPPAPSLDETIYVPAWQGQAGIDNAMRRAATTGARRVLVGPGKVSIISPLNQWVDGLSVEGTPGATIFEAAALTYLIEAMGSVVTNQSNTLASNTARGDLTMVLSAGKGANFAPGWNLAVSEAAMAGTTQKQGEHIYVESISTDTLNLAGPNQFAYTTADAAQVFPISMLKDIAIKNIIFQSADTINFSRIFCRFEWCLRPRIEGCQFRNGKSAGLYFLGCVEVRVENSNASDLLSDPITGGAFGYFVCEAGPNRSLQMCNCLGERVRHVYTTVVGGGTATVMDYGVPFDTTISDTKGVQCRGFAFDTHPAGWRQRFVGCDADGGRRGGVQLRGNEAEVRDFSASDCIGPTAYVVSSARDTVMDGITAVRTNLGTDDDGIDWRERGAIYDDGYRTTGWAIVVRESGGPGIQVGSGQRSNYDDVEIIDPLRLASSVSKAAILFTNNSADQIDLSNVKIRCDDTKMDYGVSQVGASPAVHVSNVDVRGAQVDKVSVASTQADTRTVANPSPSLINPGRAIVLTIAAGAVSVANTGTASFSIAGEGGLADDLVDINGGAEGDMVILRRSASVNITLKHATGNLRMQSGADFILGSSFSRIMMQKSGSVWCQI
jgi:hypothetical protein